jgi:transcriptional regulator with XRE-family HTH domain
MNIYKIIGENVKKKRIQKGYSQLELALEIGIKSVAFYSNCENVRYGKHFNLEHLYKLSKALDTDICEFFSGISSKVTKNAIQKIN